MKLSIDELAALFEPGFGAKKKQTPVSKEERRLVLGFEECLAFYARAGRAPVDKPGHDIFERLLAVRLEALKGHPAREEILAPLDTVGLLTMEPEVGEALGIEALAALFADFDTSELTTLKHVRSLEERRAADEVAQREKCEDFETFAPLFRELKRELKLGLRETIPFGGKGDANVQLGDWFVLDGILAYVAEFGEYLEERKNDELDARLRVIFDNKTESRMLLRSLKRALHGDEHSRRVTRVDHGPLFERDWKTGDKLSATVYVLRSLSEHPYIAKHRELIHKIGYTTGDVESRIRNAENEATFLLAKVKPVATYKLVNIHGSKFEHLIHEIFRPAQLQIQLKDRFGKPVVPREWFQVPLQLIDEAINRITDGSIVDVIYDPEQVAFLPRGGSAAGARRLLPPRSQ